VWKSPFVRHENANRPEVCSQKSQEFDRPASNHPKPRFLPSTHDSAKLGKVERSSAHCRHGPQIPLNKRSPIRTRSTQIGSSGGVFANTKPQQSDCRAQNCTIVRLRQTRPVQTPWTRSGGFPRRNRRSQPTLSFAMRQEIALGEVFRRLGS